MAVDDTVTEILKSEDVAKGRNMVFFWNLQDKKKEMVLTGKLEHSIKGGIVLQGIRITIFYIYT